MSSRLEKKIEELLALDPGREPSMPTAEVQKLIRELKEERRSVALHESETQLRSIVNDLLVGVVVHAADTSILFSNNQASLLLGLSKEQLQGKTAIDPGWHFIHEDRSVVNIENYPVNRAIATGKKFVNECFGIIRPDSDEIMWVTICAMPVFTQEGELDRIIVNFMDISERKRLQEALEKRVLALTRPLDQVEGIAFDDLFDRKTIQRIQDEFSAATGVASIITDPDGAPITEASNFTDLCANIIRKTDKGCANCYKSDATLGRYNREGPTVQLCLSAGLWDAGASIEVCGRHVANWMIGQVRDETQTEEEIRAYAGEIGADEIELIEAFRRVPVMKREQFEDIAQVLFTLVNQLSTSAYQNVQQARFIEDQAKTEQALNRSQKELRKLASALSLSEQRERQRIVAELHDGVSQFLSSAFLQLGVLREESTLPEPTADALEKIGGIIELTMKQIRSLTFGLSFPELNQLGLAAALKELCTTMTHEQAIHFEFKGDDTRPLLLEMDRQLVLYRSARELMINVLKHSEARRACVEITCEGGRVSIKVEDDGNGFDASLAGRGFSPTGGFGLFNIHEYLQHAGGSLQIESFLGKGTEVILSVPVG